MDANMNVDAPLGENTLSYAEADAARSAGLRFSTNIVRARISWADVDVALVEATP